MTLYVFIGNFVAWNTWPMWGVSGAENSKIFLNSSLFFESLTVHKRFCVILESKRILFLTKNYKKAFIHI